MTNVTGLSRPNTQITISVPQEPGSEEKSNFDNSVLDDMGPAPKRNLLGCLYDKNTIGINPISGQMIRSDTRIMEITGVWFRQGTRIRYELVEYMLPSGWDRMILQAADPLRKLAEMKGYYKNKGVELEAATMETLFANGKLWWL